MRARLPRPLLLAAGTVALVAGGPAAPAHALTISAANVNPATTADASTKNVIYYLDLHAGPADERFSITLTPPEFATRGGHDEGQSIDGPRQFSFLNGPGTLGEVVTDPSVGQVCSDRDSAFHGFSTGKSTVDVLLPAGANTTLAVRYGTGRRAPWADTDLQLRFSIQSRLVGAYPAGSPFAAGPTDVSAAQTITNTPPLVIAPLGKAGRIGAHLLLKTTPGGTWGDETAARRVKAGSNVRVSGQLLPAERGKRVELQWRKGTGSLRTAAKLTTKSGGRFSTILRVPGKGTYELWARYPTQPGALKADSTSCPMRFLGR